MKKRIAALLATALIGSPGTAATVFLGGDPTAWRNGLFAGATVRIALDQRRERPAARLAVGSYRVTDNGGSGAFRSTRPVGLEFGLSRAGSPEVNVAGRPLADVERRLGLNGSTGTLLLIGGAIALGLAAVLVLAEDNDDCCHDPVLCGPCD